MIQQNDEPLKGQCRRQRNFQILQIYATVVLIGYYRSFMRSLLFNFWGGYFLGDFIGLNNRILLYLCIITEVFKIKIYRL